MKIQWHIMFFNHFDKALKDMDIMSEDNFEDIWRKSNNLR